jgi:hypothetical protein
MGGNINFDYESLWPIIAAKNIPPGPPTDCVAKGDTWGASSVKAVVVSRGIPYSGSCTGQEALRSAQQTGMIAGGASQTAISLASHFAQAGSSLASAIPIVGSIVSAFTSIFSSITQHHATAVANEQQAACEISQLAGQTIPQIDAAVRSGQITAQQGIDLMDKLVAQCKEILVPVTGAGSGGHPCNAGCCYQHQLDCHADFARSYYMDISPITAAATPPATYAPAAPASTGAAIADALFPPPGSPTVAFGLSGTTLFLLLLVVFGIIWYIGIR